MPLATASLPARPARRADGAGPDPTDEQNEGKGAGAEGRSQKKLGLDQAMSSEDREAGRKEEIEMRE